MHIYIKTYTYTCIYMYICTCTHTYLCTHIYVHVVYNYCFTSSSSINFTICFNLSILLNIVIIKYFFMSQYIVFYV